MNDTWTMQIAYNLKYMHLTLPKTIYDQSQILEHTQSEWLACRMHSAIHVWERALQKPINTFTYSGVRIPFGLSRLRTNRNIFT
jgi:hypothetical protein